MTHTPEPWEHIGNGDIQGREDNGYGAGNVDICKVYMRTIKGLNLAKAKGRHNIEMAMNKLLDTLK